MPFSADGLPISAVNPCPTRDFFENAPDGANGSPIALASDNAPRRIRFSKAESHERVAPVERPLTVERRMMERRS
jgi:hypothetical protein